MSFTINMNISPHSFPNASCNKISHFSKHGLRKSGHISTHLLFLSLVCWPLANFLPRNHLSIPLAPSSPLQGSTDDFMICFSLLSVSSSTVSSSHCPQTGPLSNPALALASQSTPGVDTYTTAGWEQRLLVS